MRRYIGRALMMGLTIIAFTAIAQAASGQVVLWGWNETLVSLLIGAGAPGLTSLIAKVKWSSGTKRAVLAAVVLVLTVVVGFVNKDINREMFNPNDIIATFALIFASATATYQFFASKFKLLTIATS